MKKILIIYATFGTGHKSIANYVEDYFKKNNPNFEVKTLDLISYVLFGKSTTKVSNRIILSKNQLLWGAIYNFFNNKVTTFGTYKMISKFFDSEALKKEVIDFNPDLVISTHFFASTTISRYVKKNYINSKLITIITDYQAHELWLQNHKAEDAIIVGSKEAKKEIVKKNVLKSKVKIYGIPISSKFSEKYNKEEVLKKLGILNDKKIYLFFGGGGEGSFSSLPYFKELVKLNLNAYIIFIAGNNEKLKKKVQKIVNKSNNIKVLGFVNNVEEYMTISDLIITKPGGITVTECLTLKRPMVLINKTAGHEKGNFKYLIKKGFALNGSSVKKFKKTMILIQANEKILNKIVHNLNKNSENKEPIKKLYNLSLELLNYKK